MGFEKTDLPGLFLFEPAVFGDARGFFMESFNQRAFQEATGIDRPFVQDNHSYSTQHGVIRGLHFQKAPNAQAKLVRVTRGAVLDVAVDIRKGSPTYGQWRAFELTAENKRQLYVPRGFAHGFSVIGQEAEFLYKCDGFYDKSSEGGVIWNDPDLGIDWGVKGDTLVSEKDALLPSFADFDSPFVYGEI